MSEVFLLNQGVLFIFNRTKLYEALEKKEEFKQNHGKHNFELQYQYITVKPTQLIILISF